MNITRVGIVGAGTMGTGIATATALAGFQVTLLDAREGAADAAVGSATGFYNRAVERNRLDEATAAKAMERLASTRNIADLADSDLVIEAVYEDLQLKQGVLEQVVKTVRPDALIASNTSCLRITLLGQSVARPERFLGLHYFSPAQVNPIVEVVQGEATGDAAIQAALAFARETGKEPIVCKDEFGFCINRFFCPYTNEAARLLDEGVGTPGEIDQVAMDTIAVAAGPFCVMNIVKPRINLHAIRNLGSLGAFYAPAKSMTVTGDAEASWTIDVPGEIDPARAKVIGDRLRGAMFLPILQELDEGVATPAAIDLGAREALKIGRPPCRMMDEIGRAAVESLIMPLCRQYSVKPPASLDRIGQLVGKAAA